VRGLTNKQIGMLLGISHRTVEVHRARLMRKLGVSNLSGLLEIAFAQRDKLPDLDHASSETAKDQ
jgi:two-component system response regulator FixJ